MIFSGGNAQQIGQGALGVEMLGDVQFARRIAEAAEHQHQGHQRPGNVFAARGDRAVEELLQAQLLDEFQSQPRPAEIAAVLHPHAFDVHFDPLGPHVVEEPFLPRSWLAFGRLLDAQSLWLVELPEIGDHPLPRAALGAIRLHQRPVGVAFAVLSAIARANEHARIVSLPTGVPKGKVFTTTPWRASTSGPTRQPTRTCVEKPHLHARIKYDKIPAESPATGEVGLARRASEGGTLADRRAAAPRLRFALERQQRTHLRSRGGESGLPCRPAPADPA